MKKIVPSRFIHSSHKTNLWYTISSTIYPQKIIGCSPYQESPKNPIREHHLNARGTWLGKPQETTQSSLDTPLSSHLETSPWNAFVGTPTAWPLWVCWHPCGVWKAGEERRWRYGDRYVWLSNPCTLFGAHFIRVFMIELWFFVSYMIAWMIYIWYNILF